MGDAVNIGSQRQLFLDDSILERRENAARTSHEARKSARPVIWPDQPWERGDRGAYIERSSILFDPEQEAYRLW